jgi:hypothetical protein
MGELVPIVKSYFSPGYREYELGFPLTLPSPPWGEGESEGPFFLKSLLTSPAYRQAGFTKGRNNNAIDRVMLQPP